MALLHQAQLTPSKIEILQRWVPDQPWGVGGSLEPLGAYRFDDPDGEVGIETHLLRGADGRILQAPLTYRGAPLSGAEAALVATIRHSVLGQRWVYDGPHDPVYVQALATVILTGGRQADLEFARADGVVERREAPTRVAGSGTPDTAVPSLAGATVTTDAALTAVRGDGLELDVLRVLGRALSDGPTLTGTWPGQDAPVPLAGARTV
ncbi:MAG: hypothetical protein J0H43_14215 [Actinobacteria bacterium]|nr:hypothetical protein [Actinomycetota bacterium]